MSQLANLVDRKLSVCSQIEFGDILQGIDSEKDALDLVMALDLAQEDVGFTIKLINMLFKSLRVDLDKQEAKDVIKELKQLNKSIA
jgi:hypothetical protein